MAEIVDRAPAEAATVLRTHWQLGGAGVVLAQPIPTDAAMNAEQFGQALAAAEREAIQSSVRGNELTPFLLAALGRATGGATLRANQALLLANGRLGAQVALALGPVAKSPPS